MDEPGSNIQISQGVWQSFRKLRKFREKIQTFFEQKKKKIAHAISCKSKTR
jgi:hypothetical protein